MVWEMVGFMLTSPPPPPLQFSLFSDSVTWLKTKRSSRSSARCRRCFTPATDWNPLLHVAYCQWCRCFKLYASVLFIPIYAPHKQVSEITLSHSQHERFILRYEPRYRITDGRTDWTEHHWRIHWRGPPCILFYVKVKDYINITVCNCKEE